MVINGDVIKDIYNYISDEESKMIYMSRLNYSLTHDYGFLRSMVDKTIRNRAEWKTFCKELITRNQNETMVIFGAGIWGTILYNETKHFVDWKHVIDSYPDGKTVRELPVEDFEKYLREYEDETIVISSYKNYSSMVHQLHKHGITDDKIVDAGRVIYQLTEEAIYFDLDMLMPQKSKEVFVDAGCFDGLTTKQFFAWCKGEAYSYCFEPDPNNIDSIKRNLKNQYNYEIVPSALWSGKRTMAIDAKGNFATSVSEIVHGCCSQTIEAISLDDFLGGREITFIKMDIEGAEMEALLGAKKTITEQKPRLAISIYHKMDDIWKIPDTILKYCPDYRFYLRHYSFSDYDTVLYAIP